LGSAVPEKGGHATTTTTRTHNFRSSVGAISAESPRYIATFFSKLRALHRGTSLGKLLCGANRAGDM
jgi:hypothetical protein